MNELSFGSVIIMGEIPEQYDTENIDYWIDETFQNLADYVLGRELTVNGEVVSPDAEDGTFPKDFTNLLEYGYSNPLCVVFISLSIMVIAVKYFCNLAKSLRR